MLTDSEILEILQISTRLLLHYESMIADEAGISRPYSIDHQTIDTLLTRAEELLYRDDRLPVRRYKHFGFVDNSTVSALLAQALDIVRIRYGIDADLPDSMLPPNPEIGPSPHD